MVMLVPIGIIAAIAIPNLWHHAGQPMRDLQFRRCDKSHLLRKFILACMEPMARLRNWRMSR